jgi:hypothetical protein
MPDSGYGSFQGKCHRCETEANIPLMPPSARYADLET